jgi:nucleoside-diphosphate-sugar epimerase
VNKIKQPNRPTSLIIFGGNPLGAKLTELLGTQKSNLILIDEFNRQTKSQIRDIKKDHKVKTYDLSGLVSLGDNVKRIDYIFILLDQYTQQHENISSKQFLSITNSVDAILKLAHRYNSKVLLTTTIALHRRLADLETLKIEHLSDTSKSKAYTLIELQRYCETLAAEYHDQASLDIRISRIGEVIGSGINLERNTLFTNLIKEAVTKPRITIKGEGLDSAYYVHILDVVYGLIKTIFSNKTNGEVFSLSYEEEISTLSLAYKILEMNPKADEIAFVEAEDENPQQIYVPAKNLTKIGWKPKIKFEKALLETLEYVHEQYKVAWKNKPDQDLIPEKIEPEKRKKPKKKIHTSEQVTPIGKFFQVFAIPFQFIADTGEKTISKIKKIKFTPKNISKWLLKFTIFIILYIFLLAPLIQVILGSSFTYVFAKKAYHQAYSLDTDNAQKNLDKAEYFSSVLSEGWNGFFWLEYIPGVSNFYQNTGSLFKGIDHLTEGAYYLVQGIHPYVEYLKNFEPIASFDGNNPGGSRTYLNELKRIEKSGNYIDRASIEITQATNSLEGIENNTYPNFIAEYIGQLQDISEQLDTSIESLSTFAEFIPDLLGKDERKNYVVLFQNPMELRSTGGWLTSFAVIGVEHGQLRTLDVQDVYTADGQLNQEISPPDDMADALSIDEWNLALSNWNPNFPDSADAAEYFLTLEDQVFSVDGVIAIDLELVRNLVDVWGEIEVTGEDEPTTKDNLYSKVVEIHREFTPGSARKEVFLSNLSNELVKKIFQTSKDKWPDIVQVFGDGLSAKHMLIYSHNSELDENLRELGWTGIVPDEPNIVFPVEWNWGANKANHFLERASELSVNIIDETTIEQELTVTFRNNSTENVYPEGDYENYQRVFLPNGASITNIKGLEESKVYSDLNINKSVVGGMITVPTEEDLSYSIEYVLRNNISAFPLTIENGIATYTLNFIKQPGLMQDPLTIEISYPNSWTPIDSGNIQREIDSLVIRTELDEDQEFIIQWQTGE